MGVTSQRVRAVRRLPRSARLFVVASLALLAELAPDVIEIESVVPPRRGERRCELPVTHPGEHGGAADAQLPGYLTGGQQPHTPTVVGAGQRCWPQAAIPTV